MAKYGIDACTLKTIGKQAAYSVLINFIIAAVHRMIYDESMGIALDMYKVKTRKILLYSNAERHSNGCIFDIQVDEEVFVMDFNENTCKLTLVDSWKISNSDYMLFAQFEINSDKVKYSCKDYFINKMVFEKEYTLRKK